MIRLSLLAGLGIKGKVLAPVWTGKRPTFSISQNEEVSFLCASRGSARETSDQNKSLWWVSDVRSRNHILLRDGHKTVFRQLRTAPQALRSGNKLLSRVVCKDEVLPPLLLFGIQQKEGSICFLRSFPGKVGQGSNRFHQNQLPRKGLELKAIQSVFKGARNLSQTNRHNIAQKIQTLTLLSTPTTWFMQQLLPQMIISPKQRFAWQQWGKLGINTLSPSKPSTVHISPFAATSHFSAVLAKERLCIRAKIEVAERRDAERPQPCRLVHIGAAREKTKPSLKTVVVPRSIGRMRLDTVP